MLDIHTVANTWHQDPKSTNVLVDDDDNIVVIGIEHIGGGRPLPPKRGGRWMHTRTAMAVSGTSLSETPGQFCTSQQSSDISR